MIKLIQDNEKLFKSICRKCLISFSIPQFVVIDMDFEPVLLGLNFGDHYSKLEPSVHIDDYETLKIYLEKEGNYESSINIRMDVHSQGFEWVTVAKDSDQININMIFCFWGLKDQSLFSKKLFQNISHDLRSPMNSIIGLSQLLEIEAQAIEDLTLRKKIIEYAKMINHSSNEAIGFTSEIIDLMTLNKKEKLDLKPVDLIHFAKEYIKTHRLRAITNKVNVQLKKDESDQAFNVLIDSSQMIRLLDNLYTNAIKFSESGSTIYFAVYQSGDWYILEIKDNGIGMKEDVLKNLFVKYGGARRLGVRGEKSHGLGMSIVKEIVELHDGEIEVESKENIGTTIRVKLKPLKSATYG